jgi:hypothetical protein
MVVVISAVQVNSQHARWFDEYSNVTPREEKLHLDNFAYYLLKDPSLLGYIVFRVGKSEKASVVSKRAERGRQYLVREYRISRDRIRLIYLGKAGETTFILQPMTRDKSFPKLDSIVK